MRFRGDSIITPVKEEKTSPLHSLQVSVTSAMEEKCFSFTVTAASIYSRSPRTGHMGDLAQPRRHPGYIITPMFADEKAEVMEQSPASTCRRCRIHVDFLETVLGAPGSELQKWKRADPLTSLFSGLLRTQSLPCRFWGLCCIYLPDLST